LPTKRAFVRLTSYKSLFSSTAYFGARVALFHSVTRGTKLGGGALVLAAVCLGGWYLAGDSALSTSLRRHLPRSVRKFFTPKPSTSPRMANLPNLYLWAWERPEDLQFLSNRKVGVAFLAKTISLAPPLAATPPKSGAAMDPPFFASVRVQVRPRLQPLRINPGTPLMAVVRIESVRGAFPDSYSIQTAPATTLSQQDLSAFAAEIANASQIAGVTALQIDFDATLSEHALYRDLLIEVRKLLPPDFPLSITALASWCIGDRWLDQLPPGTIDEAVPMLFRMGQGTLEVTHYLANGNTFTVSVCTTSLGLSTDEPFSRGILSGETEVGFDSKQTRVYIFSPKAWDSDAANPLLKGLETWHEK